MNAQTLAVLTVAALSYASASVITDIRCVTRHGHDVRLLGLGQEGKGPERDAS